MHGWWSDAAALANSDGDTGVYGDADIDTDGDSAGPNVDADADLDTDSTDGGFSSVAGARVGAGAGDDRGGCDAAL